MLGMLILLLPFVFNPPEEGYQADSLKVTEVVRQFVKDHHISGTDLEKVHKIIKVTHDEFLFIKVDREEIKKWIRNPSVLEAYKSELRRKEESLRTLHLTRTRRVLTDGEEKARRESIQAIFFSQHNIDVYEQLIKHKSMLAEDLAFVVSGSEAIEHRIRDGCTIMTYLFIALAKAAGLEDVRYVVGANVSEFLEACPKLGSERRRTQEIDGHMVALAKISGTWALVNCTHYEPYSLDPQVQYEILYELDGEMISPEKLVGRILKLPSFQRKDFPPSELLIVGVGKNKDDDLNVENHEALMNLSVSGDRECPICKWKVKGQRREDRAPSP